MRHTHTKQVCRKASEVFYPSGFIGAEFMHIDEDGCRAASLTVIRLNGAAAPDGTAVFTLDRPFLFEIISATGQPLFAGVVNRP